MEYFKTTELECVTRHAPLSKKIAKSVKDPVKLLAWGAVMFGIFALFY